VLTSVSFVDAHQHFQDIETHHYPWLYDEGAPAKLEGDPAPIRRNYLAERVAMLQSNAKKVYRI